jgi:hypothetical protein
MNVSKGTGIRIMSNTERNLFGTVIKDSGKVLKLKLSETYKAREFESDLAELIPIIQGETFKPLLQYYGAAVKVNLINGVTFEKEFLFDAVAAID